MGESLSAEQIAEYPVGTISWRLLWSLVTVGEDVESIHDISGEPVGASCLTERGPRSLFRHLHSQMALVVDSWAYVQESMGR